MRKLQGANRICDFGDNAPVMSRRVEGLVEDLIQKHAELESELSSGKVDKKLFADKSKEYSDLNEIIKEAKEFNSFEQDKKELEKIISDPSSDKEMKIMAENELEEMRQSQKAQGKAPRYDNRHRHLKFELSHEDVEVLYRRVHWVL